MPTIKGKNLWDARIKAKRAAHAKGLTLNYSTYPAGVRAKGNGVWVYATKKAQRLMELGKGDVQRAAGHFKFKGLRKHIIHKAKPKAKKSKKHGKKGKGKKGKKR